MTHGGFSGGNSVPSNYDGRTAKAVLHVNEPTTREEVLKYGRAMDPPADFSDMMPLNRKEALLLGEDIAPMSHDEGNATAYTMIGGGGSSQVELRTVAITFANNSQSGYVYVGGYDDSYVEYGGFFFSFKVSSTSNSLPHMFKVPVINGEANIAIEGSMTFSLSGSGFNTYAGMSPVARILHITQDNALIRVNLGDTDK